MRDTAVKMFMALLDSMQTQYKVVDEEKGVIYTGWNIEGTSISVFVQFDENGKGVHIAGTEFVKVTQDQAAKMYKVLNDCNRTYRWVKFTFDDSDNTTMVECDAQFEIDTCDQETWVLVLKMVKIVEEVYPMIMKALWA